MGHVFERIIYSTTIVQVGSPSGQAAFNLGKPSERIAEAGHYMAILCYLTFNTY